MALTFVANCAFRFISQIKRQKARGLPTRTVTWTGRYDALDAFVALYPISSQYGTGWITDLDIKDTTPEASVDIIIADPPDFSGYSVKPSTTVKTFTAAGTLDGTTLFPDDEITTTEAKRSTSARVHQSTYKYYARNSPLAPASPPKSPAKTPPSSAIPSPSPPTSPPEETKPSSTPTTTPPPSSKTPSPTPLNPSTPIFPVTPSTAPPGTTAPTPSSEDSPNDRSPRSPLDPSLGKTSWN